MNLDSELLITPDSIAKIFYCIQTHVSYVLRQGKIKPARFYSALHELQQCVTMR